ncbi:hypothetical protein ACNKU7_09610 [Microbulbifer sp. SA54]|uniref:hypothetical protein n=1 Tax=Microbulbifer sp. SA54 TaxID=3401577 RepID=UPI003AAD4846
MAKEKKCVLSKSQFWSAIGFLSISITFYFSLKSSGLPPRGEMNNNKGSPVATMEYLKPTKEHHNGSILKYTYQYGTLTIDRNYHGDRDLKTHRLFAEIYTFWPEFGKRDHYLKSDEDMRLRIMFEIDKSGIAVPRDLYGQYSDNLNPFRVEDNRYPGFFGYKRNNGWVYIAKNGELVMPQGTPVVISCSDDESFAYFSKSNVGHCSYHFIFDKDLRAIVRFDKPLMKDFVQVHKDLMEFMSSVRESK